MSSDNPYRKLAVYTSLIFILPTTLLGSFYLGYLIDEYLESSPFFTMIGLFVGIVGAFYQIFQILKMERDGKGGQDG